MGHYGVLPEVNEAESDSDVAVSLIEARLKRRSLLPSPTPSRIEVKADLEPLDNTEAEAVQGVSPTFSPDTMKSSVSSDHRPVGRQVSGHKPLGRTTSGRESLGLEIYEQEMLGRQLSSQTSLGQLKSGHEPLGHRTSGEESRKTSLTSNYSSSSLTHPRRLSKPSAILEEEDTDSVFAFSIPDDQVVSEDGKLPLYACPYIHSSSHPSLHVSHFLHTQ